MSGKGYSIVFSSRTGNTAELAEAVRRALPEGACEYFGNADEDGSRDENGGGGGRSSSFGNDNGGGKGNHNCSCDRNGGKRSNSNFGDDGNCDDESSGCNENGSSCRSTGTAIPASEMLFVGFWTNQGVADQATQKLLEQLRGRKIFLFGTAGFGGSDAYFQAILDKTKAFIDDSNTVIGTYMCQGKMPQSVRERYVKMKAQPDHMPNIDAMIENFDNALSHPDANDLEKLARLVRETVERQ